MAKPPTAKRSSCVLSKAHLGRAIAEAKDAIARVSGGPRRDMTAKLVAVRPASASGWLHRTPPERGVRPREQVRRLPRWRPPESAASWPRFGPSAAEGGGRRLDRSRPGAARRRTVRRWTNVAGGSRSHNAEIVWWSSSPTPTWSASRARSGDRTPVGISASAGRLATRASPLISKANRARTSRAGPRRLGGRAIRRGG